MKPCGEAMVYDMSNEVETNPRVGIKSILLLVLIAGILMVECWHKRTEDLEQL